MGMRRPRRFGNCVAAVLLAMAMAMAVACSVIPMGRSSRSPPSRRGSDVDVRYVRSGPVPEATLSLDAVAQGVEVWDVSLPSKAAAGAPPEAAAPIGMRWWKPRSSSADPSAESDSGPARRPAVVISPILGSKSAFVSQFAERFAAEGWHAVVVFHPEIAYDPARPLHQAEERLADSVSRRIEVVDWLIARDDVDPTRLASFGISAGGIEASLAAGVDHRYVAHVIGLAGGPLSDVFVDSDEDDMKRLTATAARATGETREGLRRRLAATIRTDPIALAAAVPRDSVLLILAHHDRSVPTRNGKALRDALGRPRTIWLPLGHYASVLFLPFVKPRVVDFIRERFDAVRNGSGR